MTHEQLVSFLYYLVPVGAAAALLFAWIQSRKVLKSSEGDAGIVEIAAAIRKGANAYLHRQYRGVGIFFAGMFVILGILALLDMLNPFVPFAFLTGGFFSGLSGFIGMKIATAANSRTANAARNSLNRPAHCLCLRYRHGFYGGRLGLA